MVRRVGASKRGKVLRLIMRILIACERFVRVRDAFRAGGHDAWSCDTEPCEGNPLWHLQDDICNVLTTPRRAWDMMIAFPPCTYLAGSGLHRNKNNQARQALTDDAIRFVEYLWSRPIERIAIENSVGCLSTRSLLCKPSQIIQPYQYGGDASKKTCLWLKGLPPLRPTNFVQPRMVIQNNKPMPRWSNQTDSGQNRLAPSADRAAKRGMTYPGIAQAMADQWGQ